MIRKSLSIAMAFVFILACTFAPASAAESLPDVSGGQVPESVPVPSASEEESGNGREMTGPETEAGEIPEVSGETVPEDAEPEKDGENTEPESGVNGDSGETGTETEPETYTLFIEVLPDPEFGFPEDMAVPNARFVIKDEETELPALLTSEAAGAVRIPSESDGKNSSGISEPGDAEQLEPDEFIIADVPDETDVVPAAAEPSCSASPQSEDPGPNAAEEAAEEAQTVCPEEEIKGSWSFSGWFCLVPADSPEAKEFLERTAANDVEDGNTEKPEQTEPESTDAEEEACRDEDAETEEEPEYINIVRTEELTGKQFLLMDTDRTVTGYWTFTPAPAEEQSAEDEILYRPLYEWEPEQIDTGAMRRLGLFSDFLCFRIGSNIEETETLDRNFISVPLSESERAGFVDRVLEEYEKYTQNPDYPKNYVHLYYNSVWLREGDTGAADMAFLMYCASCAGLVDGISRCFPDTDDISVLCAYFNDKAADMVNTVTAFFDEDYEIQAGDLFFRTDGEGNPVRVEIISEAGEGSITVIGAGEDGTLEKTGIPAEELETGGEFSRSFTVKPRCTEVGRIIFDYLTSGMGLGNAAACGILANIYMESGCDVNALGDGGTSYGLCQWHEGRFLRLVKYCIAHHYNIASLEGQLRFLRYEYEGNYAGLDRDLNGLDDSDTGAGKAAELWCRVYERPRNVDADCASRRWMALNRFRPMYEDIEAAGREEEDTGNGNEAVNSVVILMMGRMQANAHVEVS